jgi:hypothetical protein
VWHPKIWGDLSVWAHAQSQRAKFSPSSLYLDHSHPGLLAGHFFNDPRGQAHSRERNSSANKDEYEAFVHTYFASASRFVLAQSLSTPTAFSGGPPCVPQAQGPYILASVMQEQDLFFRQAQTKTIPAFVGLWFVLMSDGFST